MSTHCRSATSGSTSSIKCAAVALMRRPMHDGQKPRPLQLNATVNDSGQHAQRSRAKPRQTSPQSGYASSSFLACLGS